jgi:hypothetical protein
MDNMRTKECTYQLSITHPATSWSGMFLLASEANKVEDRGW